MMDSKGFWIFNNVVILAFYGFAAALLMAGNMQHWIVLVAAAILIAHVLEIPLAVKVLKDKNPSFGRLAIGTLLFGYTWWVPAKKGIYAVQ